MGDTALKCEQGVGVRMQGEKLGIPHRIVVIGFG